MAARNRASFLSLASILALYAVLAAGIVFFANEIVRSPSLAGFLPFTVVVVLLGAVPLALGSIIAFNVRRLVAEGRRGRAAARIKKRMVLALMFLVFIAAAPQMVMTGTVVNTVTDKWFGSGVGAAVDEGIALAIEYYRERLDRLELNAERGLEDLLREGAHALDPEDLARAACERFPSTGAAEIFVGPASAGFWGDAALALSPGAAAARGAGPPYQGWLPKESIGDRSAIRYARAVPAYGEDACIVLSEFLGDRFEGAAAALNAASEELRSAEQFRPYYRSAFALSLVVFSLPLFLFSLLISFSVGGSLSRPIEALEDAMAKVSAGDLSYRIIARPKDELSSLMASFNKMVAEIEAARKESLQAERVNIWQDLARRLAHELKNPLTPIKLSAERVLRKSRTDPAGLAAIVEPSMLAIVQEVDGLAALLAEFRDFAKLPEPELEWTDLAALVAESVAVFAQSYPGVRFDASGASQPVLLKVDRGHLKQVFSNLILNSVEAMGGRGELAIRADLVKKSNARYCRIQLRDSGPGIPEDLKDKVFTPYFTTKESGTGLGLSIVEHIVFDHGGRIWFESGAGAGATFFIDLPAGS